MVNEYSCVCLHGDRRPQERKDNLNAFKVSKLLLSFVSLISVSLSISCCHLFVCVTYFIFLIVDRRG